MQSQPDAQPGILERLLEHPVQPAPISELVSAGEAAVRRRRKVAASAAAAAVVVATTGGLAITRALSTPDATHAPASGLPATSLQCPSGFASSTEIDAVPPATAEEAGAAGWPTTADAAARAIMDAPVFTERLSGSVLTEGVPVELGEGASGVKYAVVTADGSTVALITVRDRIGGAWAATQVQVCSQ